MTYEDDQEELAPRKRLFSITGLQIFLVTLLPVVALSFIALGLLKQTPAIGAAEKIQYRFYKPILLKPGQFVQKSGEAEEEIQVAKVDDKLDEEKQAPADAENKTVKTETVIPVAATTALTSTTVPAETIVTTTTTPEAMVTTTTTRPKSKQAKTAEKYNIPPPKWQETDEKWETVKAGSGPGDNYDSQKGDWKQINLDQTDKAGSGGKKTPAIARILKKEKTASGKTITAQTRTKKPTRKVIRKSSKPSLAIINASGKADLGQIYKDVLKEMGFPIAKVQNRAKKEGQTTIYYKSGSRNLALRLRDRIPGEKRIATMTWKSNYDVVLMIH